MWEDNWIYGVECGQQRSNEIKTAFSLGANAKIDL